MAIVVALTVADSLLFPDDPRKQSARGEFVRLMREHFGIANEAHHSIAYETSVLSSYQLTNEAAQGTIVLFGGFDSYIEELFPIQVYLHDAGFDVITFEALARVPYSKNSISR